MMKIKCAIMHNGQSIIYGSNDAAAGVEGSVYMEEPMLASIGMTPDGRPGIQLVPLLRFGMDESALIKKESIMAMYEVSPDVVNAYENFIVGLKAARAGIEMPTQPAGGIHLVK